MSRDAKEDFKEFEQKRAEARRSKSEREDALAQEFPFMRRGAGFEEQRASGAVRDLYGAYGCCVEKGWDELLRSLCAEITAAYEKAGQPVDLVIDQIKEKFGTLRFYYHPEGKDPGIHAIDFLGTASLRMRPGDSELHQEVAKIVHKWEKQSAFTCERCGAPGELRKDIGGWVKTLCNSCYTSTKEALEERKSQKKELLANEEKRQAAIKEFMDDQSEDTEALNYLYDEMLCNDDEDEAGEAFDGYDF